MIDYWKDARELCSRLDKINTENYQEVTSTISQIEVLVPWLNRVIQKRKEANEPIEVYEKTLEKLGKYLVKLQGVHPKLARKKRIHDLLNVVAKVHDLYTLRIDDEVVALSNDLSFECKALGKANLLDFFTENESTFTQWLNSLHHCFTVSYNLSGSLIKKTLLGKTVGARFDLGIEPKILVERRLQTK